MAHGKQRFPDDHEIVSTRNQLPDWFEELLEYERPHGDPYDGSGKKGGDISGSGYDFTIARR